MKRKEKEFMDAIVQERIQHYFQEHQEEIQPDRSRFLELAEQYQEVMSHLNEADLEVVQNYQEYVFHSSAAVETVLYKAGVLDGLRLGRMVRKIR
jgi:L-lactate utilization protein LutB